MKDLNYVGQEQVELSYTNEWSGGNATALNFDILSYQFHDLDLAIAASELPRQDLTILVLHLMGHTQNSIASVFSLSRSMISKRLSIIVDYLKQEVNPDVG